MRPSNHLNWICFVAFLLVQVLPNLFFDPFKFHELSQLLPEIFVVHADANATWGLSLVLDQPLVFSYDSPVMALAFIWPFISVSQTWFHSRPRTETLFALLGIMTGDLADILLYALRHGQWPDPWSAGVGFRGYFCFWTVVSVIIAFCVSWGLSNIFRFLRSPRAA